MDDMPPPWDDDILLASTPAVAQQPRAATIPEPAPAAAVAAAVPAAENIAPAAADRTVSTAPVAELNWDGQWPNLAAALPVRGVAQQLAQQSELIGCKRDGNAFVFELRVPLSTLLSAGSVEKLAAALTERFGRTVRVESKIGAVELTANAQAVAERAARQQAAEQRIQNDGFVQTLMREFGASIVTGSVRPI